MEGISDIKIEGIDDNRPPSAEHLTYINLYFKLNHEAPGGWCVIFNELMSKHASKAKIDDKEGLFIETWVKSSSLIAPHLQELKAAVAASSERYIEELKRATQVGSDDDDSAIDMTSPQGMLNKIISELNFDD